MNDQPRPDTPSVGQMLLPKRPVCQSIDWYAEGQSRTVEVNGVEVTVRRVGRKGPAGTDRDHGAGGGGVSG